MNEVKSPSSKIVVFIADIAIITSIIMSILTVLDKRCLEDILLSILYIPIAILYRFKAIEDMKVCDLSYKREHIIYNPKDVIEHELQSAFNAIR